MTLSQRSCNDANGYKFCASEQIHVIFFSVGLELEVLLVNNVLSVTCNLQADVNFAHIKLSQIHNCTWLVPAT